MDEEDCSKLDKLEKIGEHEIRKLDFSPQGKKFEYNFARIMRREIRKMDVPDEEKEYMIDSIFDYLLEYQNEYKRYYDTFKQYGLPSPGLI